MSTDDVHYGTCRRAPRRVRFVVEPVAGTRAPLRIVPASATHGALRRGTALRNLGALVRRALGGARHLTISPFRNGRWPLAFTVAASLLVSVVGAAPAVHADPPGDPAARLQVVIKSI